MVYNRREKQKSYEIQNTQTRTGMDLPDLVPCHC